VNDLEVLAETTAEAWEKLSLALLNSGEVTTVHNEPVTEIRWLSIHVLNPLKKPRINERFDEFCRKIRLEDEWGPEAYLKQVTKQTTKGYWWEVYGSPIWEEIPELVAVLRENPSYNKPSITVRDSKKHLGGKKTPCLVYITFQIRNEKLDFGVHFDTNAIEFIQSNMYGLTELQKIVAEELGVNAGTYHHFVDSLFVYKKHFVSLKETLARDNRARGRREP
jgi:thymidylate synthase